MNEDTKDKVYADPAQRQHVVRISELREGVVVVKCRYKTEAEDIARQMMEDPDLDNPVLHIVHRGYKVTSTIE